MAEADEIASRLAGVADPLAMLAGIFAAAPMGLQIYRADGTSLLTNQAFRDIFKSEPPPGYNVLHDEIAEQQGMLGLIRRAFSGETITTPTMWYDPRDLKQVQVSDGQRVAMQVTMFPLRDAAGVISHVAVVIKDQTAEMTAAALADARAVEAEEATERARYLAGASEAFTGSLDLQETLQGICEVCVPRLADYCVIDAEGPDGTWQRICSATSEETRQMLLGASSLAPPPPGSGVETHASFPLLARGKLRGTLGLGRTAEGPRPGPAEVALAQEFARRAAQAIDSSRLYAEAQRAVRLREDFLSIAGHELKTPLTALSLQIQTLRRRLERPERDDEALAHSAETADRQVRRLGALVQQLLDVSRLTSGRLDLEPEDVELVALVQEVASRFEGAQARGGSELTIRANGPLWGRWDRLRVDQIVTNLMTNAFRYGRGRPVEVTLSSRGPLAHLSVRDGGIGIAPKDQKRIFGRFERAASQRNYGGVGLGLWIVSELLLALGGSVRVESQLDQGATFFVELPLFRDQGS